MNISSIIVKTLKQNTDKLIKSLNDADFCEYHLHDDEGRIIVTIEGEGISEEIANLKKIKQLPYVISAEVVYSYSEEELDAERDKLEKQNPVAGWLNDKNIRPEDVKYGGDLKRKKIE